MIKRLLTSYLDRVEVAGNVLGSIVGQNRLGFKVVRRVKTLVPFGWALEPGDLERYALCPTREDTLKSLDRLERRGIGTDETELIVGVFFGTLD
ncbi:TPA: hypothetical protein DF272_05685 [Candidatus Falkowbacteria bacterium]|nr:hypothetical protein [Candidatus Falkowbacteria bacterium]